MRHIKTVLTTCALLITASDATARDHTFSNGKLTDDQFYRAVACKANIDKPCQSRAVRWPDYLTKQLTVGLAQVQEGTTKEQEAVVRQALQDSVTLINAAGANVKLKYVTGWRAHRSWIKVHIVKPHGPKGAIKNVSLKGMNGLRAQNARTKLFVTKNYNIGRVGVTISNKITKPLQLRALVLEELVQSLGLMWDIENPYYNDKSIFSQSGPDNLLVIEGQDKAALRRHYP